jgi:hypothetical protein
VVGEDTGPLEASVTLLPFADAVTKSGPVMITLPLLKFFWTSPETTSNVIGNPQIVFVKVPPVRA